MASTPIPTALFSRTGQNRRTMTSKSRSPYWIPPKVSGFSACTWRGTAFDRCGCGSSIATKLRIGSICWGSIPVLFGEPASHGQSHFDRQAPVAVSLVRRAFLPFAVAADSIDLCRPRHRRMDAFFAACVRSAPVRPVAKRRALCSRRWTPQQNCPRPIARARIPRVRVHHRGPGLKAGSIGMISKTVTLRPNLSGRSSVLRRR